MPGGTRSVAARAVLVEAVVAEYYRSTTKWRVSTAAARAAARDVAGEKTLSTDHPVLLLGALPAGGAVVAAAVAPAVMMVVVFLLVAVAPRQRRRRRRRRRRCCVPKSNSDGWLQR